MVLFVQRLSVRVVENSARARTARKQVLVVFFFSCNVAIAACCAVAEIRFVSRVQSSKGKLLLLLCQLVLHTCAPLGGAVYSCEEEAANGCERGIMIVVRVRSMMVCSEADIKVCREHRHVVQKGGRIFGTVSFFDDVSQSDGFSWKMGHLRYSHLCRVQ